MRKKALRFDHVLSSLPMFFVQSAYAVLNLFRQNPDSKRNSALEAFSRSVKGRIAVDSLVAGQLKEIQG